MEQCSGWEAVSEPQVTVLCCMLGTDEHFRDKGRSGAWGSILQTEELARAKPQRGRLLSRLGNPKASVGLASCRFSL